jgi:hypothetical protein
VTPPASQSIFSEGNSATARTCRLAVVAGVLGILAPIAYFLGRYFGGYGIRRFELAIGLLRAQLAAYAGLFVAVAIVFALLAVLLGLISAWQIRRRSVLSGGGLARAGWILGLCSFGVMFFLAPLPVFDWPPLVSTHEDQAILFLEKLDISLRKYAAAVQPNGFPESLDEFNRVEKLRESAEWLAISRERIEPAYSFAYSPEARNAYGIIAEYSAVATPRSSGARASFFIDTSGILRWTQEPRAANANDPPWRTASEQQRSPEQVKSKLAMQNALALVRMRSIASCVARFAILNPDKGVPRDQEALGADGARCLMASAVFQSAEYQFTYTPGPPDPQGKVTSFRLEARPGAFGVKGTTSYLADETGAVRATDENRAATERDPVVYQPERPVREIIVEDLERSAVSWLRSLHNCIGEYAQRQSDGGLPPNVSALRPPNSNCASPEISSDEIGGYRFAYQAGQKDARGRISSYTFTARPVRFGETGNKNYFTDETGVIRWTGKDRAANASDPSAEPQFNPQDNEPAALENIRQIWKCLGDFANTQNPRRFTDTLSQLGPGGSGCLDVQLASGQKQGFAFTYSATRAANTKSAAGFTLLAAPVGHGKTGIRSFFLDESGKIRQTRINRRPRADDAVLEFLN